MKDEVLLAAILLAAAALLLVLTMIMLYIVLKTVKKNCDSKEKSFEIPTHHYENSAFQNDRNSSVTQSNNDTRISYYSNDTGDNHKAEWPASYNMYAVSRSYAFPKAGEYGEQNFELGSRAQPTTISSSVASRSSTFLTPAVNDKSFSEEVFEGINQESTSYTNSCTSPISDSTSQQETRIWKSRTLSETASLHSHEASSTHGSTVSHSRDYRVLTEQRSYYTSFKPRNTSMSNDSTSQVDEISKSSDSERERIATHSIKTTGTKKVFTFDIK